MRKLFPHQQEMLQYLIDNNGGLLHASPRVGKTLPSIEYIKKSKKFPALIITPKPIKRGWFDELELQGADTELISLIESKWNKKRRQKELDLKKPIVIMNYEQIMSHDIFDFRNWQCIIADEIHKIKDPSTQICKYFFGYVEDRPEGQARIGLTGTPASETPLNMVSQHLWAFGEFMGFDNYPEYYYQNWRFNQKIYRDLPKRVTHPEKMKKYNACNAFCITMEDLGLGSQIFQARRVVEMNKEQEKQFKISEKLTEVKIGSKDLKQSKLGSMTRSTYDRKISAGLTCEGFDIISEEKIKDFIELYQEDPKPYVVAGYYVEQLKHCEKLLSKENIKCRLIYSETKEVDRDTYIKEFQEGKIDVIIGQIKVISEGIDFSRADDLVVISETLSSLTRTQLERRVTNINKKKPVTITTIVTKGTIEHRLSRDIQNKVRISENSIMGYYIPTEHTKNLETY